MYGHRAACGVEMYRQRRRLVLDAPAHAVGLDNIAAELASLWNKDGIVHQRRRNGNSFYFHAHFRRSGGQGLEQANRNPVSRDIPVTALSSAAGQPVIAPLGDVI